MPTKDLFDELTRRGFEIGGKDPVATLNTRLVRADSLYFDRPHGWRLKEPRQTNEAADPASGGQSAASVSSTPNYAVARGEVVHDNMTL